MNKKMPNINGPLEKCHFEESRWVEDHEADLTLCSLLKDTRIGVEDTLCDKEACPIWQGYLESRGTNSFLRRFNESFVHLGRKIDAMK
jgi:hypothetical protein